MPFRNQGGDPDRLDGETDPGPPRPPVAAGEPTREQRIEHACGELVRRWRRGECIPVEDYLAGSLRLRSDDEAILDLIDCERALRGERGQSASIEEYLARFPALAAGLHRLFLLDRALEGDTRSVGPDGSGGDHPSFTTLGADPEGEGRPTLTSSVIVAAMKVPPPSIPGFEIEAELGRGGMGVVYRHGRSAWTGSWR